MILEGGMVSISDTVNLTETLNYFIKNPLLIQKSGNQNFNYIKKNTGAVIQIVDYLRI